jgi:hypothetical protein
MEQRNCLCALPSSRACSEYMMKKQRISVWQLFVHGTWEARFYVLFLSLRRFFALINTSSFSFRVQWKPLSCNGKLVCTSAQPALRDGSAEQWSQLYRSLNNPVLQLHKQNTLYRFIDAAHSQLTFSYRLLESRDNTSHQGRSEWPFYDVIACHNG